MKLVSSRGLRERSPLLWRPTQGAHISPGLRERPGPGGPAARRSGAKSEFDPHTAEIARFAKRIARNLDARRRRKEFDELRIVAEPRFLGVLRAALPAQLLGLLRPETYPHAVAARGAAGMSRECHGDLHLSDIMRVDGRLVPFDALEFEPPLPLDRCPG